MTQSQLISEQLSNDGSFSLLRLLDLANALDGKNKSRKRTKNISFDRETIEVSQRKSTVKSGKWEA